MENEPVKSHVRLTDDEVVAIAIARETPWPTELPTVDTHDKVDLEDALFRGNRSLAVRGFPGLVDGPLSEDLSTAIFEAEALVTVYLGDSDFQRATWGIATNHYISSTAWALETTSPEGAHKLSIESPEDHLAYLTGILEAVFHQGPAGQDLDSSAGEPAWLCVARVARDSSNGMLAAVRRDEAWIGDLTDPSEGPAPKLRQQLDSVTSLANRLLGW